MFTVCWRNIFIEEPWCYHDFCLGFEFSNCCHSIFCVYINVYYYFVLRFCINQCFWIVSQLLSLELNVWHKQLYSCGLQSKFYVPSIVRVCWNRIYNHNCCCIGYICLQFSTISRNVMKSQPRPKFKTMFLIFQKGCYVLFYANTQVHIKHRSHQVFMSQARSLCVQFFSPN